MSRFLKSLLVAAALVPLAAPAWAGKLGLGRTATSAEIQAWDIDVRPDGKGLPKGRGSVSRGERVFLVKCAACHGEFGEGTGRWPVLAGGNETLDSDDPVKTVGSYWPYLSSVFDYIRRAMPFGDSQSLKADEIYAVTAYILHMNDIVPADFELSDRNFTSVRLPNEGNFTDDPRPEPRIAAKGEPCMTNCKQAVKITGRARVLDVTPDQNRKK